MKRLSSPPRNIRIPRISNTIQEANRTDGDVRTSSVAGGGEGCEGREEAEEGVRGHDIRQSVIFGRTRQPRITL